MMAKMFYTLEETKAALGRSEEEIKQLAREGRLREFRDGPRLMFKADQVEQLKGEMGSGEMVDLGVSDSGGLIGLVDTTGASGTSITLSEAGDTGMGSGSGAMRLSDTAGPGTSINAGSMAGGSLSGGSLSGGSMGGGSLAGGSLGGGSPGAGMRLKDDTSLSVDLGLSGSLGGVPSPGRPMGTPGTGLSGTAGGTRGGINVFGADDSGERVDASAQTVISGGYRSQMPLEGVGSGSGLLDLTRESDDTSLGAVLDEITPSRGDAPGTGLVGMDERISTPRVASSPSFVEAPDASAPAFGMAAFAGFLALLFGVWILISAMVGVRPPVLDWFKGQLDNQLWVGVGIGFALVILFFVGGLIVGKTAKR